MVSPLCQPLTKDGATDAHHRRALLDSDLEIVRHAHRKVPPTGLLPIGEASRQVVAQLPQSGQQ